MDIQPSSPAPDIRFSRTLSSNRVWLAAGRRVEIAGESWRIVGYIPETCLGQQAHWRRRTSEAREAAELEMLKAHGPALERALEVAVAEIGAYLATCRAEGLQPNLRKLREDWGSGEIDLTRVGKTLGRSVADMQARQRQHALAEQIGRTVRLSDYPDTFPARRCARRLIAVLGPTNSGKTHDAFERLATAASGVYLGPLRLLALEAFTRLNDEFGVSASLVTGEERRIVEGSRVTTSTIEMLDPEREIDVAVIDEIQMLSDPDRGWAWTQAVLGANAREVWLLGAPSAEPAIRALAARLGLPDESLAAAVQVLAYEARLAALSGAPAPSLPAGSTCACRWRSRASSRIGWPSTTPNLTARRFSPGRFAMTSAKPGSLAPGWPLTIPMKAVLSGIFI